MGVFMNKIIMIFGLSLGLGMQFFVSASDPDSSIVGSVLQRSLIPYGQPTDSVSGSIDLRNPGNLMPPRSAIYDNALWHFANITAISSAAAVLMGRNDIAKPAAVVAVFAYTPTVCKWVASSGRPKGSSSYVQSKKLRK